MKGRYSLSLLFILIVALASCGVKEDVYRDINFESDSLSFNIPITTNKKDTLELATLVSNKDLGSLISTQTGTQFNIEDLRSAAIIGFKIKLDSKDTLNNNLRTFSYLSAATKISSTTQQPFAVVSNNSLSNNLSIPILGGTSNIKDQLSTGKITYVIKGAADTTTTTILKCKAVIQYRLRVSK